MANHDHNGHAASIWSGTGIWIAALVGVLIVVVLLAWRSSDYSSQASKNVPAAANPDGSAPANRAGYPPRSDTQQR